MARHSEGPWLFLGPSAYILGIEKSTLLINKYLLAYSSPAHWTKWPMDFLEGFGKRVSRWGQEWERARNVSLFNN